MVGYSRYSLLSRRSGTIEYADWAELVDQRGYELGVWLAVETGVVTLIEEQWVP
ncbi:MAG TPA: hypothetical protein VMS99_09565 [Acidimicrobiia bacterium]|nr:hypothetical protein [Acidimicrobiia bacterium]